MVNADDLDHLIGHLDQASAFTRRPAENASDAAAAPAAAATKAPVAVTTKKQVVDVMSKPSGVADDDKQHSIDSSPFLAMFGGPPKVDAAALNAGGLPNGESRSSTPLQRAAIARRRHRTRFRLQSPRCRSRATLATAAAATRRARSTQRRRRRSQIV